ncbi:TPA: MFS transporter [Burkholderia vietnamiensis]|nr:MFS transporter [Burkholderia vietnamiensis]
MQLQQTKVTPRWLQVSAAIVGNALEWYDFGIYGTLAIIISQVFFPDAGLYSGLLLTTATYGAGFVTRPLGGIAIGIFADKRGRKAALQLIIALMAVSMLLLVLTPSYATIGIAAPILVLVSRLLQGLASGGEFASATAYLVEAAPLNRKGLYGSWQMTGQAIAMLLGAVSALVLTSVFTKQQLLDGAWRIPFALGLVIAPVGWWIRRHLDETREPTQARSAGTTLVLRELFGQYPRAIAAALLITTSATAGVYVFISYMPTFLNRELHVPLSNSFAVQSIALVALTVMAPITGWLSDRFGRKRVMLSTMIPFTILIYPMFHWVQSAPSLTHIVIIYVVLSIFFGGFLGPFTTALGEQFPASIRSSGLAICYNLAVMVFGGFAPFNVTLLIHATGLSLAPVLYSVAGGVLGVIGCLLSTPPSARERRDTALVAQ